MRYGIDGAVELDTIEKLGGNLDEHSEEMLNPTPSKDVITRVERLSKTYFDSVSKVGAFIILPVPVSMLRVLPTLSRMLRPHRRLCVR